MASLPTRMVLDHEGSCPSGGDCPFRRASRIGDGDCWEGGDGYAATDGYTRHCSHDEYAHQHAPYDWASPGEPPDPPSTDAVGVKWSRAFHTLPPRRYSSSYTGPIQLWTSGPATG